MCSLNANTRKFKSTVFNSATKRLIKTHNARIVSSQSFLFRKILNLDCWVSRLMVSFKLEYINFEKLLKALVKKRLNGFDNRPETILH